MSGAGRHNWAPEPVSGEPDGLVLFDGVCVLCSRWVQFVIARDSAARFRFLAIQSDRGRRLAARLGIDPDDPQTNVVVLDGLAYFKLDAAIQLLGTLPGWSIVRLLAHLPRAVTEAFYDRIARSRYRVFGRRTTCLVPSAGLMRHFLQDDAGS